MQPIKHYNDYNGGSMKKFIITSACTLLLLSGCFVQSISPFYTDDLKTDVPEIIGKWVPIALGEKKDVQNVMPWTCTQNTIESYDANNNFAEIDVTYFTLENVLYVDYTAGELKDKNGKQVGNTYWNTVMRPVHWLCKVTLSNDTLRFTPLSMGWFQDNVKNDTLPLPYVTQKKSDGIIITATTKQWVNFLQAYGGKKELFDEKQELVFTRKQPAQNKHKRDKNKSTN